MKCDYCDSKAVYLNPNLCKEHLIKHFEEQVEKTIKKYDLCTRKDRICVAASGGKDSIALLIALKKLGYHVEALAIDEGIKGYRDKSLQDLKEFCEKNKIPLTIKSFYEEFKIKLDDVVEGRHPCSVCGVFRRKLLNKYSENYDVIATGHNLDDEAQGVLMNIIKNNFDLLLRTEIKSKHSEKFTKRIKPFMFIPEKMIMAYTILHGLILSVDECPYAKQSLRARVRDALNKYEAKHKGTKKSLVRAGMRISELSRNKIHEKKNKGFCSICGQPSASNICRACLLQKDLNVNIIKKL